MLMGLYYEDCDRSFLGLSIEIKRAYFHTLGRMGEEIALKIWTKSDTASC
jgi:hypothetical protein